MEDIGKKLAQVHRYLEKYLSRMKTALDQPSIVTDSIAAVDLAINEITTTLRDKTSPEAAYTTIESLSFAALLDVVTDSRVIRRASAALTTAAEVDLQAISNNLIRAIGDYNAIDIRAAIIADTADMTDDQVLSAIADSGKWGFYALVIVGHRGLGSRIDPSIFGDAKNRALGIAERTSRPPSSIISVAPLTALLTRAETESKVGADPDAGVLWFMRKDGSTMRGTYADLFSDGTITGGGKPPPPAPPGLTNAILRKYRTIVVGSTRQDDMPEITIGRPPSGGNGTWYVAESNDGVQWAIWNGGKPLPADDVAQLTRDGIYDRPRGYHAIMEPTILARARDPYAANITSQYAKGERAGADPLERAKGALLARFAATGGSIRTRTDYMTFMLDRVANVEAILAAIRAAYGNTSLRASIALDTAAKRYIISFEKLINTFAPTDAELQKAADPHRLVTVALNATIDKAIKEANRAKLFTIAEMTIADYARQNVH